MVLTQVLTSVTLIRKANACAISPFLTALDMLIYTLVSNWFGDSEMCNRSWELYLLILLKICSVPFHITQLLYTFIFLHPITILWSFIFMSFETISRICCYCLYATCLVVFTNTWSFTYYIDDNDNAMIYWFWALDSCVGYT